MTVGKGTLYEVTKNVDLIESVKAEMNPLLEKKEMSLYLYMPGNNPAGDPNLKRALANSAVVITESKPQDKTVIMKKAFALFLDGFSVEELEKINAKFAEKVPLDVQGLEPRELCERFFFKLLESLNSKSNSPEAQILEMAEKKGKEIGFISDSDESGKRFLGHMNNPLLLIIAIEMILMQIGVESSHGTRMQKMQELGKDAVLEIVQDEGKKVLDRSFDLGEKINSFFQSNKNHLVIVDEGIVKMNFLKVALFYRDLSISKPLEFKEPTGFFWKLKSPDGKKSYFLGSIHSTPDYLLDFNAKIRKSFQKSKAIGVEVDITREDVIKAAEEQWRTANLDYGKKILESLTSEEKSKLKKLLESYLAKKGVETKELSDDAIILFGAKVLGRSISDLGWRSGIDLELTKQAKERGMPVKDLEKIEDNKVEKNEFTLKLVCALKYLPDDMNDDRVVEGLEKVFSDKMKEGVSELVRIWELGDLKALEEKVKNDSPAEKAKMMKRNMAMALKMDEYVQTGERHFFVAGTAHALGEFGILKILQNIGYTVERA